MLQVVWWFLRCPEDIHKEGRDSPKTEVFPDPDMDNLLTFPRLAVSIAVIL